MTRFIAYLKARFSRLHAPAGDNDVLLMSLGDSVAKWVAGVGGVTLAVAISFSASAYTSFIQVSEKCQARLIASDAILGGRAFGLWAAAGAAIALFGLACPHISKQLWYSSRIQKSHKSKIPDPIIDNWRPTVLIVNIHFSLIALGFCIVVAVPLAALSTLARQTSGGLSRYVQTIDAKCPEAR